MDQGPRGLALGRGFKEYPPAALISASPGPAEVALVKPRPLRRAPRHVTPPSGAPIESGGGLSFAARFSDGHPPIHLRSLHWLK